MKKLINLNDLRTPNYDDNEWRSKSPCIICGKDVDKIEQKFDEICKSGEGWHTGKNKKWFENNYIQMDTDGNLYLADEEVAEGHESQGCFAIGCGCMKKYKSYRAGLGK